MIRIFADAEALSEAAAALFVRAAQRAVRNTGRFVVALSGGQTPRRTYERLACPECRDAVPWEAVHVFWGDERCVPFEDPRRNARMAHEALLRHVPIPAHQVHPIPCEGDPETAPSAMRRFCDRSSGKRPRASIWFSWAWGRTATRPPCSPLIRR